MIKVENLSKYYGEVKAVKSISFDLTDGEIVGFLGANGAGKSTTLKVMTGYLTPTDGNVYVNDLGDDVCEWSIYIKMPDSGYGYQIQLDDEVIRDICDLWQSYQDSGATGSSKTGLFASGNSSSRP